MFVPLSFLLNLFFCFRLRKIFIFSAYEATPKGDWLADSPALFNHQRSSGKKSSLKMKTVVSTSDERAGIGRYLKQRRSL